MTTSPSPLQRLEGKSYLSFFSNVRKQTQGDRNEGITEEEIREIFKELEEDAGRLLSLIHMIKTDLILKNDERAKTRLETTSFLSQRIEANLFRLIVMVEKRAQLSR